MPVVSQSQRGLIFGKRSQYGSKENTPKKWKFVWGEEWENKGKLPKYKKKNKKKKKNENKIIPFTTMINEEYSSSERYSPVFLEKFDSFADLVDWIGRLSKLEREWLSGQFSAKYVD